MAEIKKKCELYEVEIMQLKAKIVKLERQVAKREEAKVVVEESDQSDSS